MHINEKYYILIHKEFSGEISEKEKSELSDWILDKEENRKEYEFLKKQLESVSVPRPSAKFDLDNEWNKLEEKISNSSDAGFFTRGVKYYSVAASIIVLLGLAFLFNSFDDSLNIVKNELANKKKIKLPDNSIVILNKNAEIRYKIDDETREIDLVGEAYFEVTKNNTSFVVNTPNSSVEVLGTRFNVRAKENFSSVAVKSGKVAFANEKNDNVILTANQISKCNAEGILTNPSSINIDSLIVWTKTRLVFENKTLKEILTELENEYFVNYVVTDSELLKKKLSAVFEHENLKVIHKSIETALNISITKKGDNYYIKK
ncbi:MAG: FecR family protein [Rhodothermaceae bacterium]